MIKKRRIVKANTIFEEPSNLVSNTVHPPIDFSWPQNFAKSLQKSEDAQYIINCILKSKFKPDGSSVSLR